MKVIDTTKEFLKGAVTGFTQTRKPEEVAELFDIAFTHLSRSESADICLAIINSFFTHYDKEDKHE